MGAKVFENPKDHEVLARIIRYVTAPDSGDIILDSFAGSGTTAHAVLALNAEDGGNRQFILVEQEDYVDNVTAPQVRQVIRGVPEAKDEKLRQGFDDSFTFLELGPTLMRRPYSRVACLPIATWRALFSSRPRAKSWTSRKLMRRGVILERDPLLSVSDLQARYRVSEEHAA